VGRETERILDFIWNMLFQYQPTIQVYDINFDEIKGLSLADRDIFVARISKMSKAQAEVLVLADNRNAPVEVRRTVAGMLRTIFAFTHDVKIMTGSSQVPEVDVEMGAQSDWHRVWPLQATHEVPLKFSPAQIEEFGLIIPRDSELADGTAAQVKIVPMLPDDKFCRVRSIDLEKNKTHNLRRKTDPMVELSASDLKATSWRITVEDRMPEEQSDDKEAPVKPIG